MPSLSQEGWGELWPLPERAFPERGTDSTPPPRTYGFTIRDSILNRSTFQYVFIPVAFTKTKTKTQPSGNMPEERYNDVV